ncbi:OCIA domain-containing protein 1-like isoform X3 [Dermacentor silvarum]|uniref:OCIA domain-containing protein 1-like isoform X3 n=1 Tax=Dermacentor silvarum TaxID=543639 RepID=UPI001897888C|nr:OCIA domain-containing protein 1-like isoform X3 [Dermacentor silvarum]
MATSSDMLPPSEVAAGGYDQDRRPRVQGHALTPEEIRAFQECSTESFKYRALPLALGAAVGVQYATKVGYLTPHPVYGSYLKMIGAAFVGWLVGKVSYRRQCEEKLMKLPNSTIGEALRRKYGISSPDVVVGSQPGDYASLSAQEKYSADQSAQRLDLRSYNAPQGLDDSQRPSMDNPFVAEVPENLPPAKYSTSYEELRRRNREEYERRLSAPPPSSQLPPLALSQPPPVAPSQPPVQPPSQTFEEKPHRGYPSRIPSSGSAPSVGNAGKKNKYGDSWEE